MNKPKFIKVLSTLAVSTLLLSACGGNGSSDKKSSSQKNVETNKFSSQVKNDKKEVKDGSLTYGLVSGTPFAGILNPVVYENATDWDIITFFDDSLLWTDKNYEITNNGPATFEISEDKKTITIKIKDNVKWHDGNPVTAEDLEYAYLAIGHPKYEGARYSKQMPLIEGMEDYHAGKADKISGVKVIDQKTISITYKQPNPSMITGVWTLPLNKKYLGDVPIEKLAESDKVRKNPIGFGPFKVKKIVPGEAIEFERNDDYWAGKPKLKNLTLKVVNPSVVNASLKNGDIDIAEVSADQYPNVSKLKNAQLIGKTDLYYSYIGFKFGTWDKDKKENVTNENNKFKDVRLRQAMAYAIDRKEIGDKLYHGLRYPANSPVPPSLPKFHNNNVGAYDKDVEKAKKLLDEAGYKDKNSDGFREDPNGNEFKLNLLAMSGSDTSEPLAKLFIQSWKDIGVKVELVDGRLHELNSFYKMVEEDDPKVDLFSAAWGVGSDPDPSGVWGKNAKFNNGRWVNEQNTKLLEDGISPAAMDDKYRKDVYDKWQKLIHDEVPLIPLHYKFELTGVNNRVKDYDVAPGSKLTWKDVTVTSEKAEVAK
ncbi:MULTISPECIES: oligopeptide ABC transporter substrate-binding protein [Bacillus cereus group]|uniref:oligopeptide ABC transporter substrate-binding protein n=1 Tax=Bacillus cereus group TaxID=86661 RepID=UPI000676C24F|nr:MULTISPECIES: oligopeptide ABC transporter substrate-binding protein [Bacillus cereus group]AKR07802.1 ABC transporter substrate-binding protein [Bacillus thuringiensis]MBZ8125113.1 oligopeptide ABC transporter substrate-binding protein [Bacillus thuringiensis]MCA1003716.1 oligopeptide ABC transporter substrate-binding protein [Bacillus thuringiensis]MDM8364612.1 oligopeptide ABC transporter substrate-binding protein [Bacillus thuringiensis]PFX75860.1 oligopeptide ABC transporter substrate-